MTDERLKEIATVIVEEHQEEVGKWMQESHFNSVLFTILYSYQDAAFKAVRQIREWVEDGKMPPGIQ